MMLTYQTYGVDAAGVLTHAGTSRHRQMDKRTACRIQRTWERWRRRYLLENPDNYPLRFDAPTVALRVHPVGKPEECCEYDTRGGGTRNG